MNPESALRAGKEMQRGLHEYIYTIPTALDMLGIPPVGDRVPMEPGDYATHYNVKPSTIDMLPDEYDVSNLNHSNKGYVIDAALEAQLQNGARHKSHVRFNGRVVSVVFGSNGTLKCMLCTCGGWSFGVHCRHCWTVFTKALQRTTLQCTLIAPHQVTQSLSVACQRAITTGDGREVVEQLNDLRPARAAILRASRDTLGTR